MSPEIRIGNKLIASVPDETGTYQTLDGEPIYVNVDGINADGKRQRIILESKEIGGRRELGVTLQGIGASSDRKRGDRISPELSVRLSNRPIRVTYSKIVGDENLGLWREPRQTHQNPRWIRGRGQR